MSRKSVVRIVSFCLAFSVIALGAAVYNWQKSMTYERYMDYANQRAFSELITSVSNLDSALQKSQYSDSPVFLSSLSAQIWREATIANAALAQLPLNGANLDKTQKFISQAGDYSYSLLRRAAAQQPLSAEDRQNLTSLSAAATNLSNNLSSIKDQLDAGTLRMDQLSNGPADPNQEQGGTELLGMDIVEQEFPEYATLIFDGPFSEHIDKRQAAFLMGKDTVTVQEAMERAASFIDIPVENLTYVGEGLGRIKTYCFSTTDEGGSMYFDISQAGGYIVSLTGAPEAAAVNLSAEQAIAKAKEFLDSAGYSDMKESYYTEYNAMLTINFCYAKDGVLYYPDLIKVTVSMDSGRITGFESTGYLMSHTERNLPAPEVSVETAREKVSPSLRVLSHELAVIPTDGENEVLCHEFKCETPEETHLIVYINAQTGHEQNILILMESENGTLAV